MEISNEYKSRHGFADFENNLFQITSGENIVETCNLVKVPEYTYTNTYVEKICEGNGWYSKGAKITEQITHDFYWLVVLNSKCLGVINENTKSKSSSKYAIQDLNGKNTLKNFYLQSRAVATNVISLHDGCGLVSVNFRINESMNKNGNSTKIVTVV